MTGTLLACAHKMGAPPGAAPLNAEVKVFRITASKYRFEPKEIRVRKGTLVRFNLSSSDVKHGFSISGLSQEWIIEPGKPVSIEWYADKVGTAKFKCAKFCGWRHSMMKGKVIITR